MKKLTNILYVSFVLFCIKTLKDAATASGNNHSKGVLKFIILPFFISLLSGSIENKLSGQKSLVNKIYLQSAAGASGFKSSNAEVGVQAVLKKNWSTSISYHEIYGMIPKNQPADYKPESGIVLFILPYSTEVTTNMNLISFTAGKIFSAGPKVWFTTEAGISLVNGEKVTYTRDKNSGTYTDPLMLLFGVMETSSSNYTTTKENKTTMGGMFRADMNWAFSSFMGMGTGVFANINSIQSQVGFNIKMTMGWMNRGKNEKYK